MESETTTAVTGNNGPTHCGALISTHPKHITILCILLHTDGDGVAGGITGLPKLLPLRFMAYFLTSFIFCRWLGTQKLLKDVSPFWNRSGLEAPSTAVVVQSNSGLLQTDATVKFWICMIISWYRRDMQDDDGDEEDYRSPSNNKNAGGHFIWG